MEYGTSLYTDTDTYICHTFKDREEWLKGRHTLNGIGGSDAAAAINKSPWRTNLELWMIKTGREEAEDISDSEPVQMGILEEDPIRKIFQAETKDKYEVQYWADAILQNRENPELLYSPDGLLIEKETERKGILEIKTTTISSSASKDKWGTKNDPQLPENYYIQVIHGLNVTGFDFVELYARFKYLDGTIVMFPPGTYHLERNDPGMEYELACERDGVLKFMRYVREDKEPPLDLPIRF